MLFFILTLLGIFYFPVFTLSCVLFHFDQNALGIIALIVSLYLTDTPTQKP